eukprot:GHVH01001236.1.p1 GENE.GHVH01001236.1~~GHVH01001236.1.p1  ORF type:complete len:302 (+),score=31.37 GHVH01001236.1:156-1061(+)
MEHNGNDYSVNVSAGPQSTLPVSIGDILACGVSPHYSPASPVKEQIDHEAVTSSVVPPVEASINGEVNEVLSLKFEELSLLTAEISDLFKCMSPYRSRGMTDMQRLQSASPYENYSGSPSSSMSSNSGRIINQQALAEALRMHNPPRSLHSLGPLLDLPLVKNLKTGKIDGRRVPSPMLVRWIPNSANKDIEVKSSSWSRENLGMVVSYYNPMINREVCRNFSSRRYKGRSKCEDAAKEFHDHLKEGYLPDDDDQYMNAQLAMNQAGRRDRKHDTHKSELDDVEFIITRDTETSLDSQQEG